VNRRFRSVAAGWPIGLVCLIAFIVYMRGLTHGFVAEDFYMLTLKRSLTDVWQEMLVSSRMWPLGVTFRWGLAHLFGDFCAGYHLVSLALHLGAVVMFYLTAQAMSGSRPIGLAAALIFAVYPRHHQPVMWMASNLVPLASLLSLICVYAFYRYLQTRQRLWYGMSVGALLLALLTLESAAVLFGLLPLVDVLLAPRNRARPLHRTLLDPRLYLKYVPIGAALMFCVWLNFGGSRQIKLANALTPADSAAVGLVQGDQYHFVGLNARLIKDLFAYVTYAAVPFLPLRALDMNVASVLFTLIVGLALVGLFLIGDRLIQFGILWMTAAITPYVLFAPFGNTDRYFHFAAAGFALAVASLLCRGYHYAAAWSRTNAQRGLVALLVGYAAVSGVLIQQRIGEWFAAGAIAENVITQALALYPHLPAQTRVLVVNPPTTYGQAYVLQVGISAALQPVYRQNGLAVDVYQTHDPEVIAYLRTAQPVAQPLRNMRVLLYEDGQLIDKSQVVDTLAVLHTGTWTQ
jgi:hypothetical protein